MKTFDEINQEIERAKEKAWRDYALSLEPSVVVTPVLELSPITGELVRSNFPAKRTIKRVRRAGAGDPRHLERILALIGKQVKLFRLAGSASLNRRPKALGGSSVGQQ